MNPFDLILCDIHAPLIREWRNHFAAHNEVEVFHGSILDVAADAYVSPANSFGIMDGGIDAIVSARFPLVEERVQTAIAARGEPLPIGHCLTVETGDFNVPYLLCAPTMMFPSRVAHTDNAYVAMRAILDEVRRFNQNASGIMSIAVPGLCTGVGDMPPHEAARQMAQAYAEWRASLKEL
jgi:O-acetyl-ADP-ribose deacetylase (regulator of RNase III)